MRVARGRIVFCRLYLSRKAGRRVNSVPLVIGFLLVAALSYRYFSAFLAAKLLALDDSRTTPAYTLRDGTNYHPTNKYVLFGRHFAAISGAGPLVGPVLAAQYGYAPGFLWMLFGATQFRALQRVCPSANRKSRRRKHTRFELENGIGPVGDPS